MRIAVTAAGLAPDSPLDERFGRAAAFVLHDTVTGEYEAVDNRAGIDASQGAGVQAAERVAGLKVDALITGHVGPKAFRALSSAGIEVYTSGPCTVRQALEAFSGGSLTRASSADVESHW